MSASGNEWVFVVVFFASYLAVTLGEIYWLSRKGVPIRRAMIFVFSSNFVTITVGLFVTLLIFALILAGTENAGGGTGSLLTFLGALTFPVLLMALLRRLLIPTLRIEHVGKPLPYAIASTLMFFAVAAGVPALYLFLF